MKISRSIQQEMTNGAFGIHREFEDVCASKDYIAGYIRGIEVALLDLGFEPGVAREVAVRLKKLRKEFF